MNKTVKMVALAAAALMILAGCATEKSAIKEENSTQVKTEETAPVVEAAKTEEPTEKTTVVASTDSVDQEKEAAATSIKKGDTVTIDGFAEISVSKQKFSKKIEPSKPGSFYTYYESKEDDSTYFALTVKAKNLYTTGVVADEIANVTLVFDNQYDYPTFSTVEEKGGEDFTYSNITSVSPLKTTTLYYIAEIPNEVAKSDKPLKAVIKIHDEVFEYTVR